MRWRLITFNAATLVELPRAKKYEIEPLTLEEARTFLDSLKGHRLEALYVITLLLGLREGEVLGLLITNLDFAKGTVPIDGTLQWQSGKLVREATKTQASGRVLPLPPSLVPLLKAHLARQQARFPGNPYVFASTAGTPINPRNLVRQFKALLKKAGLREIRFHDLRHSCATFLIASGAHPRMVMEILGHSQIATTMNTYGHVLHETQVAAVNSVDTLLAGEQVVPEVVEEQESGTRSTDTAS
jgi:integrase